MFLGHFAVGLAAKPLAPRAPLPVLLLAPLFLDALWPIFVSAGLERARVVPGLLPVFPLDLEFMPYSHSLVAALGWGVLFALVYGASTRDRRGAAVTFVLVVSHWLLDVIAHRPDMPVLLDGPRLGLGLWRSVTATLAVEGALFAAGVLAYTRATRPLDPKGARHLRALVVVLAALELGMMVAPTPTDLAPLLGFSFAAWLLLAWAGFIERHRGPAR